MKHSKQCPECGGTEIYTKRKAADGLQGPVLSELKRSFSGLPEFDAFICAECGHYQLFIGEEWLAAVPEKWERHN